MDKYLDAEKELAEALGYHNITDGHFSDNTLCGIPKGHFQHYWAESLPQWCRDDGTAFRLAVEHGLSVYVDLKGCNCVEVESYEPFQRCIENFEDHPDKLTATRYAIVQACIMKLKAKND